MPRSHHRAILATGAYAGIRYTNRAILLAADCNDSDQQAADRFVGEEAG
jgi:hypothetical protein